MTNRQMTSDKSQRVQDLSANDPFDQPMALAKRAVAAAANMKWDTMRKLIEQAQTRANAVEGEEAELARGSVLALVAIAEGVAIQLQDSDPERYQRAMAHYDETRNHLLELRSRAPDETIKAQFDSFLIALESQSLQAAKSKAEALGDRAQVLLRDAQIDALMDGRSEEIQNQLQAVRATRRYVAVMGQINEILAALNEMDLARALRMITEVREASGALLTEIRQGGDNAVLFTQSVAAMSGAYQIVEALESYVRALHDAIVGDVARAHILQLVQAENLMQSGVKKLIEGQLILGAISPEDADNQAELFNKLTIPIRNLHALCEKSLKPKNWIASAGFKFIFVFLTTAIALIAVGVGVAATSRGAGFSDRILTGYILLVSFVVALIGGFGFEAVRFLPFANLLLKARPAVNPSSEEFPG